MVYVNVTIMIADTEEELIEFARKIGLPDTRVKSLTANTGAVSYYELNAKERSKAVGYGAGDDPLDFRDCLNWLKLAAEKRYNRIKRDRNHGVQV